MLSYLVNTLVEELSSPSGSSEQVEGTLHCLRAAQEAVPQEENDWLPRLFSSDVLGLLPATGDSRARATALDLIGASLPHERAVCDVADAEFLQATTLPGSTLILPACSLQFPTSSPPSRRLRCARPPPTRSSTSATCAASPSPATSAPSELSTAMFRTRSRCVQHLDALPPCSTHSL